MNGPLRWIAIAVAEAVLSTLWRALRRHRHLHNGRRAPVDWDEMTTRTTSTSNGTERGSGSADS